MKLGYASILITIVVFSACSSRQSNNQITVNYLSQHLMQSMITVNKYNEALLSELEDKTKEPSTEFRAKIWYAKASKIYEYSKEIILHINSLWNPLVKYSQKDKETLEKSVLNYKSSKELKEKIITYYKNINEVDSVFMLVFKNQLSLSPRILIDSLYPVSMLEKKLPIANSMALLQQFQSNIMNVERQMIQFCNNKVGITSFYFDTYSVLYSINTAYALPGSDMEIMAGIGAFSRKTQPVVTIAGKPINMSEDAAAHYKFKASSIPGKHKVPVKIEYTDYYTGKQETIEKNVEYTVAQ